MKAFQIKTLFAVVVISLAILFFEGCRDDDTNPPPPDTKLWTLDLTWNEGGRVVADPEPRADGKYLEGTEIRIEAIPDREFKFSHWDGHAADDFNKIVVPGITGDLKIEAIFTEKIVEVTDDSLSVEFEVRADREPRQQLDIASFEILSPDTYELLAVIDYSDRAIHPPPQQIREEFYFKLKDRSGIDFLPLNGGLSGHFIVGDNPDYVGLTKVTCGKWGLGQGVYTISVFHIATLLDIVPGPHSVHGSVIIVKKDNK